MTFDDLIPVAERVITLFSTQNWTLATAESCTGGLISAALTAIAGSSAVLDRGFVTYSNQAKMDLLGVPPHILDQFGAVSQQTAMAMAEGAVCHAGTTFALSVTGIAGPGGGSADKPVGLVHFGWAQQTCPTLTRHVVFPGDRQQVRLQTARFSLQTLIDFAISR